MAYRWIFDRRHSAHQQTFFTMNQIAKTNLPFASASHSASRRSRAIRLSGRCGLLLLAAAALLTGATPAFAQFVQGDLVVSTSTYELTGQAANLTVGQALPGGGNATANGTYPNVFNNAAADASFGVTSPIFLEQFSTTGIQGPTIAVPPSMLVTSFPSKSEIALNLSPDGHYLTFMGYVAPVGSLDVSNSNTPGIIEPGNPVTATPTYRAVAQMDSNADSVRHHHQCLPGK